MGNGIAMQRLCVLVELNYIAYQWHCMCDMLFIRKIDLCYRLPICQFILAIEDSVSILIEFSEINLKRTIESHWLFRLLKMILNLMSLNFDAHLTEFSIRTLDIRLFNSIASYNHHHEHFVQRKYVSMRRFSFECNRPRTEWN